MLKKFPILYFVSIVLLLLCAYLLEANSKSIKLPISVMDDATIGEVDKTENDYIIYVSSSDNLIFPMRVVTSMNANFVIPYYGNEITNQTDDIVYTTFSLLTNYSNRLPIGTMTIIPPSTRIIDYKIENNELTLNLTKEFLNYDLKQEKELLMILTYTFTEALGVERISFRCENEIIKFNHTLKVFFTQSDFVMNAFYNSFDSLNYTYFPVYYYQELEDHYYLVKTTIVDTAQSSIEEKINELLLNNFNIPLISFVSKDDLRMIIQGDDKESLGYYQFYFTCIDNDLPIARDTINIEEINTYRIEINW